jgi:hypothetical protein
LARRRQATRHSPDIPPTPAPYSPVTVRWNSASSSALPCTSP